MKIITFVLYQSCRFAGNYTQFNHLFHNAHTYSIHFENETRNKVMYSKPSPNQLVKFHSFNQYFWYEFVSLIYKITWLWCAHN